MGKIPRGGRFAPKDVCLVHILYMAQDALFMFNNEVVLFLWYNVL